MKHLNATAIFQKVAQLGSFSQAASALGIAKSSVSRAIVQLEKECGVALLYRNSRRFSLTEEGGRLLSHCEVIVSEYETAMAEINQVANQARGLVRVSIPTAIGQTMIAPVLPSFLAQHPELSIDMDLSHTSISQLESGIDLAIIFGALPDSGMVATKLADISVMTCASPEYLAKHGTPSHPEDLVEHDLLLMNLPNVQKQSHWLFEDKEGQKHLVPVAGKLTLNDTIALKNVMLNHGGIVALPPYVIAEELAQGRVIRVLKGYNLPKTPLFAVFHDRARTPPKVRMFLDFVKEQVNRSLISPEEVS
ncbi:LysR family transcriptional regulator [Endozoicomonas arenosclerae]|uniref:LysR family transcriptional regulator n=1 Tax=Endozoicomonas arenosclerae TaxID=1633495 RepID=UPI000781F2CE|nr:LysR family transcriptional regulator [Endozoicomonas arenosclerae]